MKNILSVPFKYILRTYDLKGSKLGRQVLDKNREYLEEFLRKKVLKENEFQMFEGKISLEVDQTEEIKQILTKDS